MLRALVSWRSSTSAPMGVGGRLGGKDMDEEHEAEDEEHADGDRVAAVANMVLCWWTGGGSGGR